MNEHEKQRRAVWADAYMRCALGERIATREQVLKFADMLLAEYDRRFPAPAAAPVIPQPQGNVSSAMGYVPAPGGSRVEKQVAVTGRAEAWDLSKAIEKLRGSVFHPNHVEQMLAGKEYVVKGREKKGDTTILHMELVDRAAETLPGQEVETIGDAWVRKVSEIHDRESEADRMWRASKSFDKGQI